MADRRTARPAGRTDASDGIVPLEVLAQAYRQIVESFRDGVILVDDAGRIVLASPQVERMFGYAPGELRGEPVERLVPQSLRVLHECSRVAYAAELARRPLHQRPALAGRRKDGSIILVEISLNPLPAMDGQTLVAALVRGSSC